MHGRSLIAAVALVLVAATPAYAEDWLPKFQRTAEVHWANGAPPPCGQPIYQWVDASAFPPNDLGVTLADANISGPCVVRFNTFMWHYQSPAAMCRLVVHELGHLYGHTHDEPGIMAPMQMPETVRFSPCDSVTAVRARPAKLRKTSRNF